MKNTTGLLWLALSLVSVEATGATFNNKPNHNLDDKLFPKKQFDIAFEKAMYKRSHKQISELSNQNTAVTPIQLANLQLSRRIINQVDEDAAAQSADANVKLLAQANSLFAEKDYEAAYALLEPLEEDLAGDLKYDALLAKVALASGQPTNAIMALERAIAINPDDMQARGMLAQAYYQLSEFEASKAEFETIIKHTQSEQEKQAINRFISSIDRNLGLTTRYGAYLDVGLGWDSNANSATNDPTSAYSFPGLPPPNLVETDGEVSTKFMQLAGGLNFSIPATDNIRYIGSLAFNKTLNHRFKEFEIGAIDINAGIQYRYGKETLSLTLQNNHFFVEDDAFREAYGVIAQWQHMMSSQAQFSVYGQYSKLDFEDFDDRDADRYVLGINAVRAFQVQYRPILFAGIYVAQEDAGIDFWDQHIYGTRFGGQLTITPRWVAYGRFGYERREYQDISVFSQVDRIDDQYDASIGVNFTPAPLWTIKPKISYIKNNSNELVYEYDRSVFTVNVQRDFNW